METSAKTDTNVDQAFLETAQKVMRRKRERESVCLFLNLFFVL